MCCKCIRARAPLKICVRHPGKEALAYGIVYASGWQLLLAFDNYYIFSVNMLFQKLYYFLIFNLNCILEDLAVTAQLL